MGRWLRLFAILVPLAVGCGQARPVDRVIYVADDDPRMNAAIKTARSTSGTMISALMSPKPGQSSFSVKVAFSDGGEVEHMWLSPVRFDGTNFQGEVNNDPEKVQAVKIGQMVTIAPEKISDWMYVEKGKLIGGHTLRVLRDAMSPAERADFDKNMPFVVE